MKTFKEFLDNKQANPDLSEDAIIRIAKLAWFKYKNKLINFFEELAKNDEEIKNILVNDSKDGNNQQIQNIIIPPTSDGASSSMLDDSLS